MGFLENLSLGQALFLVMGVTIAFAFEFVNGFHDTANAVATVIYTNSLRPWVAVTWSGLCNFAGVLLGGIGVAYSIVYLLPPQVLIQVQSPHGQTMIFALLLSALTWNFGTWYVGLPASSSHALIGSILGASLIYGFLDGNGHGVKWSKAIDVGMSLLLSPMIGFLLAAAALLIVKRTFPNPTLHRPPKPVSKPPFAIRSVLALTCTGVSVAHGSNDGQKGMGLIMLILIGIAPAQFALDMSCDASCMRRFSEGARELDEMLADVGFSDRDGNDQNHRAQVHARELLAEVSQILEGKQSFADIDPDLRWRYRGDLLELQRDLKLVEPLVLDGASPERQQRWKKLKGDLNGPIEYVPTWVVLGVAVALGVGTTIGWKRIVITVGEKIGKLHLTYSQGACAEMVAMSTISLADFGGLPVSTTQVLSSGVAGTMWANRSGIRVATVKKIAMAWVFTLPATMAMSALFYACARLFL